jgi:hypothetical protein
MNSSPKKEMSSISGSELRLVRGTRLTSFLFIAVSIAIAAGILFAANIYYDIDTGKIMVNEVQRVTGLLEAAAELYVTGNATTTGNLYVLGDTILGNASSDTLTFKASTLAIPNGLNIDSGTLVIDALNNRVGIATSTPSATFSVTGDVMVDGDLKFVGPQTIEGSGTLTIKPTNTLYLFTNSNYIDSSGNLVLAGYASSTKVISPELEYSGNIKIDANSSGNTTITVTNEGTGIADLVVEGDIIVSGGKITLATGETIDAETADQVTINSDGLTIIKSGGTERLRVSADGVKITGQATTTDTLYITSGGAKITGSVIISSGNITVQGNILPSANLIYTLGDASTYWNNIYVATTTIGSPSSQLVIDVDTIRAPGALTVESTGAGTIALKPSSGSNLEIVLGGAGLLKIGSNGQFYIDASGNATTSGTIYASRFFETGGGATIRKTGEQIVRGVVPIFGFDLPVRCKTSCSAGTYATISRVVENADDIFPSPYPGTVRKYRFAIRYADATTTVPTTWQVATSSDPTYVSQFTLPPTSSTDLAKGFATTTSEVTLPDNQPWFLRVTTGGSGNYELQVYEILLIGLDEVQ